MKANLRGAARLGLITTLVVSLVVCLLATGVGGTSNSRAGSDWQIDWTPDVATLEVAETLSGPGVEVLAGIATGPTATLGPGQTLPPESVSTTVGTLGDHNFGWGEIRDAGGEITGRLENGFMHYVAERDSVERQIIEVDAEGIGSGIAMAILAGGLGLCPESVGIGCIVGVVGAFAVATGNAVRNGVRLFFLERDLDETERNLFGRFEQALQALP